MPLLPYLCIAVLREEFAAYLAVRREQQRRSDLRSAAAAAACAGATAKPTRNQLLLIAFASGIPFIGFGFCDNAIMLLAGEGIESSLGVTLGISTLAAAGLGNLISDVAGLGLADSIGVGDADGHTHAAVLIPENIVVFRFTEAS